MDPTQNQPQNDQPAPPNPTGGMRSISPDPGMVAPPATPTPPPAPIQPPVAPQMPPAPEMPVAPMPPEQTAPLAPNEVQPEQPAPNPGFTMDAPVAPEQPDPMQPPQSPLPSPEIQQPPQPEVSPTQSPMNESLPQQDSAAPIYVDPLAAQPQQAQPSTQMPAGPVAPPGEVQGANMAPVPVAASESTGKNKKVMKLAIIGIIIALLITGLSFGAFILYGKLGNNLKLADYSSSELGYSIKYPEGWDVNSSQEWDTKETNFIETSVENDNSEDANKFATMFVSLNDNLDLEDYSTIDDVVRMTDQGLSDLDKYQKDLEADDLKITIGTKEKVKVGKYEAYKIDYGIENFLSSKGEIGSGTIIVILVDKGKTYTFNIEGHESDKKFIDNANEMYDTFSVN